MSEAKVYVGILQFPFRSMVMSHMGSPDLTLLHKMAEDIGIKRKWFQDHPMHPHYDISKGKKQTAIKHGAVEVSDKELIRRCYPKMVEIMNIEFYCGDEVDSQGSEKCGYQCSGCNDPVFNFKKD